MAMGADGPAPWIQGQQPNLPERRKRPLVLWLGVAGGSGLVVIGLVVVLAVYIAGRLPERLDTANAPEKQLLWGDESARGIDPERSLHFLWVDGETVVRMLGQQLAGFDLESGQRRWSTRVGDGKFCALAGQGSDGRGYAWGLVDGQCRELRSFESSTGVVVDRTDLRPVLGRSTTPKAQPPSVVDVGKHLVLLATDPHEGPDRVIAVERDDPGQVRWRASAEVGCEFEQSLESSWTVLVAGRCDGTPVVDSYDSDTGRHLWQAEPGPVEQFLDTSPPTLLTAGPRSDILVLDGSSGGVDTRIQMTQLFQDVDPLDTVISDGVAVVRAARSSGEEVLLAYDLDTGERLWHRIEERYSFAFLDVVDQGILVVAVANADEADDAVVRFSARSGEPKVVAALRPSDQDISTDGTVTWTGRHLVAEFGVANDDHVPLTVDQGPLVYK